MTCCSVIACRGCAVKNLLKAKKCWSADCGKDATTANMKVSEPIALHLGLQF